MVIPEHKFITMSLCTDGPRSSISVLMYRLLLALQFILMTPIYLRCQEVRESVQKSPMITNALQLGNNLCSVFKSRCMSAKFRSFNFQSIKKQSIYQMKNVIISILSLLVKY